MKLALALSLWTSAFLGAALPANAAENQIQVSAADLHAAISERLDKPRKAQIFLRGGRTVEGLVTAAPIRALQLEAKLGGIQTSQAIPYEDIQGVRLDLGPSRAWQIGGGILGFWAAGYAALALTNDTPGAKQQVAAYTMMPAGAYAGVKLGGRNRKWLAILVQP